MKEVVRSMLMGLGILLVVAGTAPVPATAQNDEPVTEDEAQDEAGEEEGAEDEEADPEAVSDVIFVTGSRIPAGPLTQRAPVVEVGELELERSGSTNLGATLQQLPSMGSGINLSFNVPGNSGFPQDGNGIGAGAIELALRNLGAKRTLVLVDGKRWIPGASASGVPVAVDLNTIPANVIQKIEVLQDGASAIYGSDAIGGVVNIITKQETEGMEISLQGGSYHSEGDGESTEVGVLWGGGDRTRATVSVAYYDEQGIFTSDRAQSAFPNPFATSCDVPGTLCSSFTPQGRFVLGPAFDFFDATLDDGVLNDGGGNKPQFDPNDPNSGGFHQFTSADRFNYNGNEFNYLLTPNERINFFTGLTHEISPEVDLVFKGSYTNRKSDTRAAPEPLCLGNGCGNRILENIVIDADQIYNPFGVDLSVADGTLEFIGRRPLESGARIFQQDVDTYFGSLGLEGDLHTGSRSFLWDATASYGENRGFQQKFNSHNAAKLAIALGDPALCAATPNCVPFNIFGGQGPSGQGSITQEMLDYVRYTQRDFSDQTLFDLSANVTGDLVQLPTGMVGFAAGVEYREHEGSFQPDPIAASGETAGIPSAPTAGGFDVAEVYTEVNVPLVFDAPGFEYLELNLAGRYSDYSTFGGEDTYKIGGLWKPITPLSLRASFGTGIRAPGIGELFGGAAREDFTFLDPCVDVLGQIGSGNGGRDTPQPQSVIDNCAALGVGPGLTQRNPQLSAVSAGNERLVPETSDNYSFGIVYGQPTWSVSADFYDLEIENAVQGRDPGEVITACVQTLDPFFCDAVQRTGTGQVNLVDNQLQNIGGVEASGADLAVRWTSGTTGIGKFDVGVNATYLDEYIELTNNPDGSLTDNDRTGTITNETFQRAFPEWKALSTFDWSLDRWMTGLTVRWVDEMIQASGNTLDSKAFVDVLGRYAFPFRDGAVAVVLGARNVLDEDPATCDSCGVIGMAPIVHDLPGRVLYLRLHIDMD